MVPNCCTGSYGVGYLSDSLEKSWQFPGRDGKAAVCASCPQKSRKEHCSLGEAQNPAVSSAVPASCREACIKKCGLQKLRYETGNVSQ